MTLTFVGFHFSLLSILCNRNRVAFVLFLASAPALGDVLDAAFPHARDLERLAKYSGLFPMPTWVLNFGGA